MPAGGASDSFMKGFAFMAEMAQKKRNAELDTMKLAQQDQLREREYELSKQRLEETKRVNNSLITHRENLETKTANSAERQIQEATTFADYNEKVADEITTKYKLTDPEFVSKQPWEAAQNFLAFKNDYQFTNSPQVKSLIKQYEDQFNSHTTDIRLGGSDKFRKVPTWQIVADYNNPDTREKTLEDMIASGYGNPAKDNWFAKDEPAKLTDPILSRWVEDSRGATSFKKSERKPVIGPYKGIVEPKLPSYYNEQSNPEAELLRARKAVELGAPLDQVKLLLQEKGIDPNDL